MKTLKNILFLLLLAHSRISLGEEFSGVDALINAGKFKEARSELSKKDTKSFETLWRLSRIEVFEADGEISPEKKIAGYQRALSLAEKTIEAAPKESHGYLRRASAAGKIALYKGVLEVREMVLMLRESAEKAIVLNTGGNEIQAWSHYVLGRAHLKLSDTPAVIRRPVGLGWGNLKDAETHLLRASQLKPNSVLILSGLAKFYKKVEKDEEAQKVLNRAKSLPITEPTDKEGKAEL